MLSKTMTSFIDEMFIPRRIFNIIRATVTDFIIEADNALGRIIRISYRVGGGGGGGVTTVSQVGRSYLLLIKRYKS